MDCLRERRSHLTECGHVWYEFYAGPWHLVRECYLCMRVEKKIALVDEDDYEWVEDD